MEPIRLLSHSRTIFSDGSGTGNLFSLSLQHYLSSYVLNGFPQFSGKIL